MNCHMAEELVPNSTDVYVYSAASYLEQTQRGDYGWSPRGVKGQCPQTVATSSSLQGRDTKCKTANMNITENFFCTYLQEQWTTGMVTKHRQRTTGKVSNIYISVFNRSCVFRYSQRWMVSQTI